MSKVITDFQALGFFSEAFEELAKDKKKMVEIDDLLFSVYKFPFGFFQEIVSNNEKIDELNEMEVILILIAIHRSVHIDKYDPYNYFGEKLINKALKYRHPSTKVKLEYPLSYPKTLSGSEYDYVTKMSYRDIKDHAEQIWTYNFNTQRLPVETVKKDGTITQKPKVNKKSVEEIKQLMLSGKYKPDSPLVVNIVRNGEEEVFYDEDSFELIIEKASEQNIIDGFHRESALIAALEENPELEGYLYVSYRNYTIEEARFFLGQHNSFNTFDKTHVRRLKSLKIVDRVVEDLEVNSDLNGRIATKTAVERKKNKITNFAVLSDAIKDTFNPQDGKERIEVAYTLGRFFDYLIGSYKEAFVGIKNIEEIWNKSWINHHNTFVFYVTVAHGLYKKYGKDFPLDEIPKIVDSVDFTKESGHQFNDLITGGGTAQGKVNSNQTKVKIRQFAEKLVEDMYGSNNN